MKLSKAAAFSFVYLGTLLACILFGWESWPFSDFGVFRGYVSPADVKIYRLAVEKEGGGVQWLFTGKEARRNKNILSVFGFMSEEERRVYIRSFLPEAQGRYGKEIVLVMYEQHLSESPSGWKLERHPYLKVSAP
jgi:hypothetical protein